MNKVIDLSEIIGELRAIESELSALRSEQRDIRNILLKNLDRDDSQHSNTALLYDLLIRVGTTQDDLISRLTKESRLKVITDTLGLIIPDDPLCELVTWDHRTKQSDIPNGPGQKIYDGEGDEWICCGDHNYIYHNDVIIGVPLPEQEYRRDWEDLLTYYGPMTNRPLSEDEK